MQYCVQDNSLLIRQNYFIYWTNFNSFHTLALYLFAYKILLDNYVMISIISACCHRYSVFDTSIDRYKVYKVETIGDAYMVASGLPTIYERHAQEMSLLALELLDSVKHHVIEHLPQQKLQLRIGLHSGSSAFIVNILAWQRIEFAINRLCVRILVRSMLNSNFGQLVKANKITAYYKKCVVCDLSSTILASFITAVNIPVTVNHA